MFRKQKGITLIALVITIIVLLILAGVSINMVVGENGILGKAQSAVTTHKESTRAEEIKLAWAACETEYMEAWGSNKGVVKSDYFQAKNLNDNLNGGTVSDVIYNGEGNSTLTYTTPEENTVYVTISKSGQVSISDTPSTTVTPTWSWTDSDTSGTKNIGDVVTHSTGENFYIISTEGDNYALLAEKNIDTTSLAQSNSAGKVTFSSTNYWSSIEGITYPYDLNNIATSAETDAIAKARAYGTKFGGIGRLMTIEEYEEFTGVLVSNQVPENPPDFMTSSAFWWTASADNRSCGYVIRPNGERTQAHYTAMAGVRPVIEISKSSIQ